MLENISSISFHCSQWLCKEFLYQQLDLVQSGIIMITIIIIIIIIIVIIIIIIVTTY